MVETTPPASSLKGARIASEPTLLSEALALLASANAATTRERRVLKSTVREVTVREYEFYRDLPEESRKVATLRAVNHFLGVATETPAVVASGQFDYPTHADLLPSCHPLSRRVGRDDARARWLSADPAVPAELRPLVASALEYPFDSVEGVHARERLRAHVLPTSIKAQIDK